MFTFFLYEIFSSALFISVKFICFLFLKSAFLQFLFTYNQDSKTSQNGKCTFIQLYITSSNILNYEYPPIKSK